MRRYFQTFLFLTFVALVVLGIAGNKGERLIQNHEGARNPNSIHEGFCKFSTFEELKKIDFKASIDPRDPFFKGHNGNEYFIDWDAELRPIANVYMLESNQVQSATQHKFPRRFSMQANWRYGTQVRTSTMFLKRGFGPTTEHLYYYGMSWPQKESDAEEFRKFLLLGLQRCGIADQAVSITGAIIAVTRNHGVWLFKPSFLEEGQNHYLITSYQLDTFVHHLGGRIENTTPYFTLNPYETEKSYKEFFKDMKFLIQSVLTGVSREEWEKKNEK